MSGRARRTRDPAHRHDAAASADARRRVAPADRVLALQRTLGNAGVAKLLRAQKYIRAAQNVSTAERDINTASTAAKIPQGNLPDDLAWWLEGMGAMSTTRYNPGQRQYYSPVGLVVELERDEQVHGNYAGDGNTGTLVQGMTEPDDYWHAFEAIRVALFADADVRGPWQAVAGAEATIAITSEGDIPAFKGKLQTFLATQPGGAVKDQAVRLIEAEVRKALHAHYSNPKRVASKSITPKDHDKPLEFILGPGLNPQGLTTAEQALLAADGQTIAFPPSGEAKYTESKAHVKLADIKAAYYAVEPGTYAPPPNVTADWTQNASWRDKRWQDAEEISARIPGGSLQKLENGSLGASGPAPKATSSAVRLPEDVQNVMEVTGADADAAENALALEGRNVQRAIGRIMGF